MPSLKRKLKPVLMTFFFTFLKGRARSDLKRLQIRLPESGYVLGRQSWAFLVFLNFFNNKKLFFSFFFKFI